MSPLQFPGGGRRGGSPFPQRRQANAGGRRPTFGRSAGGGLKVRLLIALAVAAFAFLSYYMKSKDVNEITGESERVALTDEAQEIQLGLQAAPQMVNQHGGPSRSAADQDLVERVGWRLLEALNRDLE
ncbi:MAG: hypothetical protein ACR2NM_03025, partial [Bythopirellula sp.]